MGNKHMNIIVIPAYEPDEKLVTLTTSLIQQSNAMILVVNDGSGTDFTKNFTLLNPSVRVIGYSKNHGKGHALKYALNYITHQGWGSGTIVTADADGQHTPADIVRVLAEAEMNPKALVLGSRAFDTHVPWRSRFGNTITRTVFSWINGQRVMDTQTGLRAFSTESIPFLVSVNGERYEYEMNMLLDWSRDKRLIREVTIETVYHDTTNSCSHYRPIIDSFRIYKQLLQRSTPLLFALSSFSCFLVDYGLFLLLTQVFGTGAVWGIVASNILARIVSASINYNLNRIVVFKSHASPRRTGLAYATMAASILAGNSVILSVLRGAIGLAPALAKILTELMLYTISYVGQKQWVFRSSGQTNEKRITMKAVSNNNDMNDINARQQHRQIGQLGHLDKAPGFIVGLLIAVILFGSFYAIEYGLPFTKQVLVVSAGSPTNSNLVLNQTNSGLAVTVTATTDAVIDPSSSAATSINTDSVSQTEQNNASAGTISITDNTYTSDNLQISIKQYSSGSGASKITWYIADIQVKNLRLISTCFADGTYGRNITDYVLNMAEENNAVLAVNGDYYSQQRNNIVIRNGKLYQEASTTLDLCVLYNDGTMVTYHPGEITASEAIARGAWQAWNFGPALLSDDGNTLTSFNTSGQISSVNPRTAIGYYEPGHYCLVVVDGRSSGYSRGMTLSELSQLFKDLGCTQAFNLDGGKSSVMTFNGAIVNQPADGGRQVSDAILIG
jgi:exopolysaccharide biosynthesis protein/putative flippase GtrA